MLSLTAVVAGAVTLSRDHGLRAGGEPDSGDSAGMGEPNPAHITPRTATRSDSKASLSQPDPFLLETVFWLGFTLPFP